MLEMTGKHMRPRVVDVGDAAVPTLMLRLKAKGSAIDPYLPQTEMRRGELM